MTLAPDSLDELIHLLESRKSDCIFRGQSPHDRLLNSTLARELRGETTKLPRNYIPKQPLLKYWTPQNLHQYHKIILGTVEPHEDVTKPLNGNGDQLYEVIRYIQQNPKQEKIKSSIPNLPTPTLEFSENPRILPDWLMIKTHAKVENCRRFYHPRHRKNSGFGD